MTEEEMQRIQDIIEEIQFEHSEDHFNMLKDKINWLIRENKKGWEIVNIAIKERDHYIADRDALQARIDGALEKLGDGQQYAHYASQHANTDGKIAMAKLLLKAIEILKGEPAHD